MKKLKFNENGQFKIVQFTDLHVGAYPFVEEDLQTLKLMEKTILEEKPDLVVVTGDLIWSEGVKDPLKSYEVVLDVLNKTGIPFAIVHGNHDTEENITRSDLLKMEETIEQALSKDGEDIKGRNNYSIPIYTSSEEAVGSVLYMLDSGAHDLYEIGTYEWILPEQVSWFLREAKTYHEDSSNKIPSLSFFHIPLPEYKNINLSNKTVGVKNEEICSPELNSGFYTALFEQGDVMATFVGHDHDNDFCGNYHGISLGYGRVSGFNCYGELTRGARIITLSEQKHSFQTYLKLSNGEETSHYTHHESTRKEVIS
jgi:predicted phosphodiesterase